VGKLFVTFKTTSCVRSTTADVVSYLMLGWKYFITVFVRCCLVQGTCQWLALVNTATSPQIPYRVRVIMSSYATLSFSRGPCCI